MRNPEVEVNLSTASLWPAASLLSTHWSERVANRIEADGLEVLPGRSVVKEYRKTGSLNVNNRSAIGSLHESWRRDRRQEKTLGLPTSLTNRVAALFFPNEEITTQTLRGLETIYDIPVVFHWPEDTDRYQNPILELHYLLGKTSIQEKPWSPEQIISWVGENPQKRGLVLDLSQRKFGDYCQSIGLEDHDKILETLKAFLPHARFIQFQIGNAEEFRAVQNQDGNSQLAQLTRAVKESQTEAPFVIEVNFPLMLKVFGANTFEFYSKIVQFIRGV